MPAFAVCDDFYRTLCPEAQSVIAKAVNAEFDKNLKNAAGLIRMAYHDCFVEVHNCFAPKKKSDGFKILEIHGTDEQSE